MVEESIPWREAFSYLRWNRVDKVITYLFISDLRWLEGQPQQSPATIEDGARGTRMRGCRKVSPLPARYWLHKTTKGPVTWTGPFVSWRRDRDWKAAEERFVKGAVKALAASKAPHSSLYSLHGRYARKLYFTISTNPKKKPSADGVFLGLES